eukprot:m.187636 g.187636  ORF g.187636 m.187636 type:complete len:86 (+) comp15611_c0_seq4:91-348(+)
MDDFSSLKVKDKRVGIMFNFCRCERVENIDSHGIFTSNQDIQFPVGVKNVCRANSATLKYNSNKLVSSRKKWMKIPIALRSPFTS